MNIGTSVKGLAGIGANRLVDAAQEKLRPSNFIRRPRGIAVPHAFHIGSLWIVLDVFKLPDSSVCRIEKNINSGDLTTKTQFAFLAPNSIIEAIGHTWDSYETILSMAQQKVKQGKTFVKKGGQIFKTGKDVVKSFGSSENIDSAMTNVRQGMGVESPVKYKVDTPLVYQDSNRRKYDFEFNLIDEGDPGCDIMMPIRKLEEYSSAQAIRDAAAGPTGKINFPYVFRISSFPSDMIKVKYAALEMITATYNGPYKWGYPTSATLQLSFVDLEPTYSSTFTQTSKLSITFSGKADMITKKATQLKKDIVSSKAYNAISQKFTRT